jgi:predicted PurR-regulated permease PerM
MSAVPAVTAWQRAFFILGTFVLAVAALWWAQRVLILLALAILIAFVLQPVVLFFHRAGLRRVPAVALTVVVTIAILGALGWVFGIQLRSFTAEWPAYHERIQQKINELDPWGNGYLLSQMQDAADNVLRSLLGTVIAPLVETILDIVFVTMLVVFILLRREDLRNRVIRLVGPQRRTAITTRALDEAAQRISRYLLTQVLINASFGTLLALGLFFFGMPYPLLWGFLAAAMRFIPYVGTWIILGLPLFLSLATAPSWWQPLEVLGLFLVLELVTANLLEPFFFGLSVGVSPFFLLVAAIFWGWLWGPIGFLLSTPMTVCLLVLGRYVPQLGGFEVLLGDEPALDASINFYQRLLARDQDEAADVIEHLLENQSLNEVFDSVIIPALVLTRRDRESGELDESDASFILETTRRLVADVSADQRPPDKAGSAASVQLPGAKATLLACPAVDDVDELAVALFQQALETAGIPVEVASGHVLSSEVAAMIEKKNFLVIFIASLPPGGLAQTRYLCKRLRARFPRLKIVVGRWGRRDDAVAIQQRLRAAGADLVGSTLLESRDQVLPLVQSLAHVKDPDPSSVPPTVRPKTLQSA